MYEGSTFKKTLFKKIFQEAKILVPMAFPLVISQIGQVTMGVVDIMMIGHYDPTALAGVTMGSSLAYGSLLVAMGILMALDPLISQNFSRKEFHQCGYYGQSGILLAFFLSIPFMLLFYYSSSIFHLLHQKKAIIPLAVTYLRAFIPGVLPFLLFISLRQFLQSLGKMKMVMWVVILANGWNLFADWVLIYGKLGFPEMGVQGAGLATSSSKWILAIGLAISYMISPISQKISIFKRSWFTLGKGCKELLRIGIPIGIQMALEVWAFTATTFLIGMIGAFQLAGHQIALNLASLVFMFPIGLGAASCVRMGHLVGQKNLKAARTCVKATLIFSILWAFFSASLFYFFPHILAAFYTQDKQVQHYAVQFLRVAAIFQISDGLQAVSFGILRGMGDTKVPMLFLILGYWFLGLPFGIIAGFYYHLGPIFLWWGLVIGLTTTSALLLWRIYKLLWLSPGFSTILSLNQIKN